MSGRQWGPTVPPSRPPPRILTGDDFVASFVPPDWLVDGVIQKGRLYACTSPTAHGKTAVWLYIGCMVHAGRMVGSLDVFKGNVLILAGENPEDLKARMLAMCRHYKIPSRQLPYVLPRAFPLNEQECAALKQEILSLGVEFNLILGDTAAAFFPGDDENDNVVARRYASTLRSLTELPGNPAVVALCHPIKNATRDNLLPRGGGAFLNELDGNTTLWSPTIGEVTILHWQGKIRGPDFPPLSFRLVSIVTGYQDTRGRDVITVVAEPMDEASAANNARQAMANEDVVLKALHDEPGVSITQICANAGWMDAAGNPERWRANRAIQSLAKDNLVHQERARGPWIVTKKGERMLNGSGASNRP